MIYLNFFSVGALIPVIFFLFLTLYLFSIKNKSVSTSHFAITFAYLTLFNFGYLICSSVYHPAAAFHRWITVLVITLSETHVNMFMLYFLNDKKPKYAKLFLFIQYFVSLTFSGIFFLQTFNAKKIFHFDGHYWDFDAETISKIIGIVIVSYIVIFLIILVWRFVNTKTKDKWGLLLLGGSYLVGTLVPAIMNVLSREGVINREVFQLGWDLFTMVGLFFFAIFFINYTKDRSTFISKILGIFFLTFVAVMQFISYFALGDKEKAYDEIQNQVVSRIMVSDYRPDNLEYIVSYSPQKKSFSQVDGDVKINWSSHANEFTNSFHIEKIAQLPGDNFHANLELLLNNSNTYFAGYKAVIAEYMNLLSPGDSNSSQKVLDYIKDLESTVRYRYKKISKMPDENLKSSLQSLLSKDQGHFGPFSEVLLSVMNESGLAGHNLKVNILKYLAPVQRADVRKYRIGKNGVDHYISFMNADLKSNKIYEVGFSYVMYRDYIHPAALTIIIILGCLILIVRFGFTVFFMQVLITPLRNLSQGVRKVNTGNLDVDIPIGVEDEMGYITRSFNSMVFSIREQKVKLQDYAENLEFMVQERTEDLKNARDALWGEMELAKKLQTVLLPAKPEVEGYQISTYMAPAAEVGGDYYDIINCEELDWIIIGDVSGHGVPAGLIMMMAQTAIRTALAGTSKLKPSALINRINRVLTDNIRKLSEGKYMTITCFACLKNGKFYFSGLHQDILVYRAKTNSVDSYETEGALVGIFDDIAKMVQDDSMLINVGDTMLIYTDGITEAWKKGSIKHIRNPDTDMFGMDKLKSILSKHGNGSPDDLKRELLNELKEYDPDDDITLVILKRVGT